jgi:hypothetical protein
MNVEQHRVLLVPIEIRPKMFEIQVFSRNVSGNAPHATADG